ncbi:MAG: hypothetical protein AAF602_09095 [Myxococcota bacterium]
MIVFMFVAFGCPRDVCEAAEERFDECLGVESTAGFGFPRQCDDGSLEACRSQCVIDSIEELGCAWVVDNEEAAFEQCEAECTGALEIRDPPVGPQPEPGTVPLTFRFLLEGSSDRVVIPGVLLVSATWEGAEEPVQCANREGQGCTVQVAEGALELTAFGEAASRRFASWGDCTSDGPAVRPSPEQASTADVTITGATTCDVFVRVVEDCSSEPFGIAPVGQSTIEVGARGSSGGPYLPITPTLDTSRDEDRLSFLLPGNATQMRVTFADPTVGPQNYLDCEWRTGMDVQTSCSFQADLSDPLFPNRFEAEEIELQLRERTSFGAPPCREGSLRLLMQTE